jgi:putative sugar O-methyltransferase
VGPQFPGALGPGFEIDGIVDLVHFLQETHIYAQHRTLDDPIFDRVIDGYARLLESQGHPLSSHPPLVQESYLGSPKTCVVREGRRISAQFLYYLCLCVRILDNVPRPLRTVIEIGAGYGGLARLVKLFEHSVQYWIVDLPETIYFSYSFLRANFPEAKCAAFSADSPPVGDVAGSDFVFVPTDALAHLAGRSFDLAINTSSLGEMTQAAVERYFHLLEQDTSVRYFYSMNRYGQYPTKRILNNIEVLYELAPTEFGHWLVGKEGRSRDVERFGFISRTAGPGACDYATPFDPYWSVLLWDPCGENTFGQIEPSCPPSLECLVERIPRKLLCDAQRKRTAENLLEGALKTQSTDRRWERLMWESVRIFPCEGNLVPWLEFLKNAKYDEFHYFTRLYDRLRSSPAAKGP